MLLSFATNALLNLCDAKLTRVLRRLRRVRTGYAYQPPALGTYRTHRAARPQGPTYCTYGLRVPATGVPYVPRTVAPQASPASVREMMAWGEEHADQLAAAGGLQVLREEHGAPKRDG